jgi:hypothetical protein
VVPLAIGLLAKLEAPPKAETLSVVRPLGDCRGFCLSWGLLLRLLYRLVSFAASAISASARRKYISRVFGFLVLEACRLKYAALSPWKRWCVLTLVPLLN